LVINEAETSSGLDSMHEIEAQCLHRRERCQSSQGGCDQKAALCHGARRHVFRRPAGGIAIDRPKVDSRVSEQGIQYRRKRPHNAQLSPQCGQFGEAAFL
jgi:hypothetical protein